MREITGISRFERGTQIWNRSGGAGLDFVLDRMIGTRPAEREEWQRLTATVGM